MQIGGYLCGGDDVLVARESFNTLLVGSFAEAIKTTNTRLDKTIFYQKSESLDYYTPTAFTIPKDFLISGLNYNTQTKDILKCDNTAMSYQVPETQGGTTFKNPSGPEVKIAHINITKPKDENDNEVTKVVGIDCFYSLCDTNDKTSLVDSGVALANENTLKDYADKYAKDNDYAFDINEVEIYNSVSTRVEPKGGGCYGSFCDPHGEGLTLCLSRSGMEIGCWNVSQMCKDTDKNMCEETDQILQTSLADAMKTNGQLPIECGTRMDKRWLTGGNDCQLGAKFGCPFGFTVVYDYLGKGETKYNGDNKMGCWKDGKEGPEPHDCVGQEGNIITIPVTSGWAVDKNVSAICCYEGLDSPDRGVCIKNFDTAYEKQKLESSDVKGNCTEPNKPDPCTVTKTITDKAVSYNGTCKLQEKGFVNNKLVENTLVCMPENAKVCHLGKKDKVMYKTPE
ncbi:MAG: hypothetical protein AAB116_18390, partial [Candidatus Poribacteria bacterium]